MAATNDISPGAAGALALQPGDLRALRQQAEKDPKSAAKEAAKQFEALFMQQLLKSMRAAVPKSGMFEDSGRETWEGMHDAQLAQKMSGQAGGLGAVIERQLTAHLERQQQNSVKPTTALGPRSGIATLALDGAARGFAPPVRRGFDAPVQKGFDAPAQRAAGFGPPANRIAVVRESGGVAAANALNARAALAQKLAPRQSDFVNEVWEHAQVAQRTTGINAAFIVGQAALESGWGKREIRMPDGSSSFNLFGIKATPDWEGRTADVTTTEYVKGKARKVVKSFRAYDNYEQAFQDWARLMNRSGRYSEVLKASNAGDFAQGLHRAGYATDPRYADKLEQVIHKAMVLRRVAM